MKREALIAQLTRAGCIFVRHGARHDLYRNPVTGRQQPIPRHSEIDEHLARHILKILTAER
jgi:predicted RNA binding protein YcfA (HicA-like mRNA interferase family)